MALYILEIDLKQYVWVLLEFMEHSGDKVVGVFSSQDGAEHARNLAEDHKERHYLTYWIERKEIQ